MNYAQLHFLRLILCGEISKQKLLVFNNVLVYYNLLSLIIMLCHKHNEIKFLCNIIKRNCMHEDQSLRKMQVIL